MQIYFKYITKYFLGFEYDTVKSLDVLEKRKFGPNINFP